MATFTLEYWKEDEWFVGRLREVAGVFSQGESLEDLEENVRDAYRLMADTEPAPTTSRVQIREIQL